MARQQLCDGAQRGSDQRSRHSNVKQHEHQPANDAGASAAIPLAYFTLANIRGLKPRTVPSKVSFFQDLLQHNCQLFAALIETWLQEHLDAKISIDGYTIFRQDRVRQRHKGRNSGGVALYLRNDIAANAQPLLNYSNGVVETLASSRSTRSSASRLTIYLSFSCLTVSINILLYLFYSSMFMVIISTSHGCVK